MVFVAMHAQNSAAKLQATSKGLREEMSHHLAVKSSSCIEHVQIRYEDVGKTEFGNKPSNHN